MTYHEAPDPRTRKAPEHQAVALKGKRKNISNTEILPSKFEGLSLEDGRYRITKGAFKGKTAFRCPECSRGLVKSGEKLMCGEHGYVSEAIDLRKVGIDKETTKWALEQYAIFLEEAKEEGFNSVDAYVKHLIKTEGENKESYTEYAKLGVGLEKHFEPKSKPTPVRLFDYESVEDAKEQFREGLDFSFVGVKSSILGGRENVTILITVSKDPKSEWANGILQNSSYAQIHINRNGVVEQFSGWRLKMRKFKGKNIEHVIEKINKIKVVE